MREFEEVGILLPEVEESVLDLARFNTVVKLAAFAPFKSGANALDNMNSISEGTSGIGCTVRKLKMHSSYIVLTNKSCISFMLKFREISLFEIGYYKCVNLLTIQFGMELNQ